MPKLQTILVIEDEQTILKAISIALEEAGFKVLSAIDGETGEQMAVTHAPDLILLDIILPRKNGLDVLKGLKGNEATNAIPVILLTNLSDTETVSQGVALGARGYLVKANYSLDEVVTKVKDVLKKSK
ncbi:MAG: response regulator [Patescibacteria group bacterium]